MANNLEVGSQFPTESEPANTAFQQQNKLNLSLNMNAFLSGLYMGNEVQGINDFKVSGLGDAGMPRANMDYTMHDNLNFMNLQSRIYDMHNLMKCINSEGDQGNDPQVNLMTSKSGFPLTRSLLDVPYNAVGSSSISRNTPSGNNFNNQVRNGNSLLALGNEGQAMIPDGTTNILQQAQSLPLLQ